MLLDGIFCFGMFNSLLNPIIYGAFHLWKPPASQSNGITELKSVRRKFSSKSSFLCQSTSTPTGVVPGRTSTLLRTPGSTASPAQPFGKNSLGLRKPPVQRCHTTESSSVLLNHNTRQAPHKGSPNPSQPLGRGTFMLSRCATFDVPTSKVDRQKVSMKRRQIKEINKGLEDNRSHRGNGTWRQENGSHDYTYDYTQEILGEKDEILDCSNLD